MLGPENAIWDDGEWVSWAEINSHLWQLEMRERYPNADLELVPFFKDLLELAQRYYFATNRHLQIYGDLGELFAAITYGMQLVKVYAEGHDGRIGNDFVEVKTITPFKQNDVIEVKLSGNFNKLVVVKITEDFEVSSLMVDRSELPKSNSDKLRISWADLEPFAR
jgi:hypothetical protein